MLNELNDVFVTASKSDKAKLALILKTLSKMPVKDVENFTAILRTSNKIVKLHGVTDWTESPKRYDALSHSLINTVAEELEKYNAK